MVSGKTVINKVGDDDVLLIHFIGQVLPEAAEEHVNAAEILDVFTVDETKDINLIGLPIWVEHQQGTCCGVIYAQNRGPKNTLIVEGYVEGNNKKTNFIQNKLKHGSLDELSLHHKYKILEDSMGKRLIHEKIPFEVSLCKKGRRQNCKITYIQEIIKNKKEYKLLKLKMMEESSGYINVDRTVRSVTSVKASSYKPTKNINMSEAPQSAAPDYGNNNESTQTRPNNNNNNNNQRNNNNNPTRNQNIPPTQQQKPLLNKNQPSNSGNNNNNNNNNNRQNANRPNQQNVPSPSNQQQHQQQQQNNQQTTQRNTNYENNDDNTNNDQNDQNMIDDTMDTNDNNYTDDSHNQQNNINEDLASINEDLEENLMAQKLELEELKKKLKESEDNAQRIFMDDIQSSIACLTDQGHKIPDEIYNNAKDKLPYMHEDLKKLYTYVFKAAVAANADSKEEVKKISDRLQWLQEMQGTSNNKMEQGGNGVKKAVRYDPYHVNRSMQRQRELLKDSKKQNDNSRYNNNKFGGNNNNGSSYGTQENFAGKTQPQPYTETSVAASNGTSRATYQDIMATIRPSPTLVGYSKYHQDQVRDSYNQKNTTN